MTYLLTAVGLTPGGSSTVHIYTQTVHRTTQRKQNIQNRTYITIRIHKHKNKNTQITKLNKSTQNIITYKMVKGWNQKNTKECDRRKSHISSKLHMIYTSSKNIIHPVTKTFTILHPTTLHSTSLHLWTLHFLSFKLHPTTLH